MTMLNQILAQEKQIPDWNSMAPIVRNLRIGLENMAGEQSKLNDLHSNNEIGKQAYLDELNQNFDGCMYDYKNYMVETANNLLSKIQEYSQNNEYAQGTNEFSNKIFDYVSDLAKETLKSNTKEIEIKQNILNNVQDISQEIEAKTTQNSNEQIHSQLTEQSVNEQQFNDIQNQQTQEENTQNNLDNNNYTQSNKHEQEIQENNISEQSKIYENTDNSSTINHNETETNQSEYDINDLSEHDKQTVRDLVKDLRRYDWVKYSLLNDDSFKISENLKNALQNDLYKDVLETACASQPPFEYEGELPFTSAEESEINNIVSNICSSNIPRENMLKTIVDQIKQNGSESLKDTWNTLSEEFNGSHKYFYLTREYLQNMVNENIMEKEDNDLERTK